MASYNSSTYHLLASTFPKPVWFLQIGFFTEPAEGIANGNNSQLNRCTHQHVFCIGISRVDLPQFIRCGKYGRKKMFQPMPVFHKNFRYANPPSCQLHSMANTTLVEWSWLADFHAGGVPVRVCP